MTGNLLAQYIPLNLPKGFDIKGGKAIFVDFLKANYTLTYNLSKETAVVKAEIQFESKELGFPIFDSVVMPTSVKLNGVSVEQELISTPDDATKIRIAKLEVPAGIHQLSIELPLNEDVDFADGEVRSTFFMADLNDRNFLEQYVPTSFEYDQVAMEFTINVEGKVKKPLTVFTNGDIVNFQKSDLLWSWNIKFPDYFNVSSPYLHLTVESSFGIRKTSYKSIDGRLIPVTVYSKSKGSVESYKNSSLNNLKTLENYFGPWPHPNLVVYVSGRGGMEYCGATRTSSAALKHEMIHSYIARGVMPANGNAGWFDEAVATWGASKNWAPRTTLDFSSSNMAGHSVYRRSTDKDGYGKGMRFVAYLDNLTKNQGGFNPFLRFIVKNYSFQPMRAYQLRDLMQEFYGPSINFSELYDKYIFGSITIGDENEMIDSGKMEVSENPYHPVLNAQEKKDLL